MKILLPTDFSKLSKVAVHYAVKLAKEINAEIILLHVVYIAAPSRTQAALKANQILDAMVDNAKQDFAYLINEIKEEITEKINISYKIVKGFPVEDVVETFALNNNIDFIIMGIKGVSGLTKVLIGSNATAVIGNSSVPVITVPEHARFNNIRTIVYPSDMLALNKEVKTLIQFAQLFNSTVHILHIVSPNSKKKIDKTKIKNDLINKFDYKQISVHVSINDNIIEAIDEYVADMKADILAMFTNGPTFFEKLFGKSVTREMAFHIWTPMLTYKRTKE